MNALFAIFYRDYRMRITNLGFLFWDLFVPVAYLLLFGTGLEKAMPVTFTLGGQEVGYSAFFLPGVLSMAAFGIAMNTSWGFFIDKDSGVFYELLTYPITRAQFLVGKVGFNVLLSGIGSALAVALGVLVMDIDVRWDLLPVTAFAVALTTSGWFFMFSAFAIALRRMDSFNTLTSASYILFMFLSSMFYPLEQLPAWFRVVARLNPMTWQVDLFRYGLLGAGDPAVVALQTAAYAAFTAVCLAFAVRALNRAA